MGTSTYKTSTILVSTGSRTRVFKSLDEMPGELRKRVSENIAGPNSRTLVVADRRGREYLMKALHSSAASVPVRKIRKNPGRVEREMPAGQYWIEIGLITLLGVASWALFTWT
jgi:hypothetical protein